VLIYFFINLSKLRIILIEMGRRERICIRPLWAWNGPENKHLSFRHYDDDVAPISSIDDTWCFLLMERWSIIVDVSPPIACHGGTRGSMFGLQRMRNSMVNVRDSRFILVRTLDRGSSNSPTSSQCFAFALDWLWSVVSYNYSLELLI